MCSTMLHKKKKKKSIALCVHIDRYLKHHRGAGGQLTASAEWDEEEWHHLLD